MYDVEGKQYIDYIGSWGPMILGHNNPHVIEAVKEAVDNGLSFGAPTVGEIDIAEEIKRLIPSVEEVRLVSSGTEAGMSAIRLARRLHRPQQDCEVRGLLPRPQRLSAGQRRLRPADVRHSELCRCPRCRHQRHDCSRIQQSQTAQRALRQRRR